MIDTAVRGFLHKFIAALPHVLTHVAVGMLTAAALGGLEVARMNQRSINEFNGIALVMAVFFTGPVACALAAPLHFACHARASTPVNRHMYSVAISLAMYAVVWTALHV